MSFEKNNGQEQRNFWKEDFGDSYVDRSQNLNSVNETYKNLIGLTFNELYESFFKNFGKDLKII